MISKEVKKKIILGILFFLPVMFLLILYPTTHNAKSLDIVNENVIDLDGFTSDNDEVILLKDHLTVLGFLGKKPNDNSLSALNLKEIIYDKFKGFKKFQIVVIVPNDAKHSVITVKKELNKLEPLKYWHFVYGDDAMIQRVFNSLKSNIKLDQNLASSHVFIVDKELKQRGRFDDREEKDKVKGTGQIPLYSYNCIEISELKNKMASEDMRMLFTEYRQKRKGNFNSGTRRESDLKGNNEEN